jgi:hypothetical protein
MACKLAEIPGGNCLAKSLQNYTYIGPPVCYEGFWKDRVELMGH